jgi:O-antigen ligase
VVALLIVPLTMLRLSPGRRRAAIGVMAVAGVLAVVFVPQHVVQRLATTSTEVQVGGISGRARIWKAGLRAFIQKPVIGYGPGGFRGAVRPYLGLGTQVAHNSYISVLVEEGLVGFLLYGAMLGSVWVAVLRLPLLERRFALILLSTLAVAMLPLTWEDRRVVWFIMAALIGLSQAARLDRPEAAGHVLPPGAGLAPRSRVTRRTEPMIASPRNAGPGTAP